MPLSAPSARKPIHNRTIVTQGYQREDGLWDIEGHLVDTKSYNFKNQWRGGVKAGEPVHEMRTRLTVDNSFTVVAIECVSDNGPFPTCGAIVGNYQRLVGQKIGPGWNKRLKSLVGGAEGCAHHLELIRLLATVAFQTVGPLISRQNNDDDVANSHPGFVVNTCHIWRADGEMVRNFFPDDWAPEPAEGE